MQFCLKINSWDGFRLFLWSLSPHIDQLMIEKPTITINKKYMRSITCLILISFSTDRSLHITDSQSFSR